MGSQREHFISLIRQTSSNLGVQRFAEIEAIFDKYLYKRAIFCRPFLEVWEEVVAREVETSADGPKKECEWEQRYEYEASDEMGLLYAYSGTQSPHEAWIRGE